MSFPATPTVGQQAAVGGRQFVWQGSAWDLVATVTGHAAQHATGGSDAITAASIGAMSVTGDSTMTGVLTVQPAVGPVKPDGSLRVIGDNTDANLVIQRHSDINGNPSLRLKRTRGTKAAQTVAQSGDNLGAVAWHGVSAEGDEVIGGSIVLQCTAEPVAGDTSLRTRLAITVGAGTSTTLVASFTPTACNFPNTLTVGGSAVLTTAQAHTPSNAIDWLPRGFGTIGMVGGASGMLSLAFFTAPSAMTVTTITFVSGGVVSESLTLCKFALFAVSETISSAATVTTPSVTMVAQTASDTTVGNVAYTLYSRTFSTAGGFPASYTLVAGTRYAVGFLLVGTTPGQWQVATATTGAFMRLPPAVSGAVLSLSDMPTSATSVPVGNYIMYGRLS